MSEKEKASRLAATIKRGSNKSDNINLSFLSKKVKSDLEYYQNIFTRFKLLRFAQILLSKKSLISQNSNFFKCHRIALGAIVSLMRNPESRRAYYNHVCTCGNSKLCPVCSVRIMGKRSAEIRQAVHAWLAESPENTCYMLTLTLAHSASDNLIFLLRVLKNALIVFWKSGSVNRMFALSGRAGRITSTEIQFSRHNGFHPHQHILVFCKKFDIDVSLLRRFWLSALETASGSASWEHGLNCIEARSAENYLCKISSEMAMGNLKQGRATGHYSPMQILFEAASGADWAENIFCELFQSLKGMNALRWSRGLKARSGINEVSDQQITDGEAQPELLKFLDLFSEGFKKLSTSQKAVLQSYAACNDFERAVNLLTGAGVEYFKNYNERN